jgi:hypothetical protein
MKTRQVKIGETFAYRGVQYRKVSRLEALDAAGRKVQFHRDADIDAAGSNSEHAPVEVNW